MHFKIRGKRVRCERWNQELGKYEKVTIVDLGCEIPNEQRGLFTSEELDEYQITLDEYRGEKREEQRKSIGFSFDISAEYLIDDVRKDPECLSDEKRRAIVDSAMEIVRLLEPRLLEPPKPKFRDWLRGLLD
jgi:hypothetical protein